MMKSQPDRMAVQDQINKKNLKIPPRGSRKAPAIDLKQVSRSIQSNEKRIFDLPAAPVFRPTEQEFQDPLRYIDSIRAQAQEAGICKIIPPENWKPEFALDTRVCLSISFSNRHRHFGSRLVFKDSVRWKAHHALLRITLNLYRNSTCSKDSLLPKYP